MAEQDLVVWCGPISNELAKVQWAEPTRVLVVPMGIGSQYDCSGSMKDWTTEHHVDCHGSQAFGRLYQSLPQPSDLAETKSDSLLRRYGLEANVWRTQTIASFSAGHGLVEPLLRESPLAWDCVYLADSYYTGAPAVKPGMAAFAERAVQGKALFIATCSASGNAQTRACNECIAPLIKRLDLKLTEVVWPGPVQPEKVWTRGKACIADFGSRVSHGDHAKVIAPPVMQAWVSPTMAAAPVAITVFGNRSHALSDSQPAPWEPQRKPGSLLPWYVWASAGVVGVLGLIGAGYLGLRAAGRRKIGGASEGGSLPWPSHVGETWTPLRGDWWLLPDGTSLSANNASHAEVAMWWLESKGKTARSIWEAKDKLLADGAVRVAGYSFEVRRLDDAALRRMQEYLTSQLKSMPGRVFIEQLEPQGSITPYAADVAYADSARRLWRDNVQVAELVAHEAAEDRGLWFSDYWITPEGDVVLVYDVFAGGMRKTFHEGVAADLMLRAARTQAERQALGAAIKDHGAVEEYLRRGAVRVLHTADFHVWRLNSSALERIQRFLDQYASEHTRRVGIEDSSRQRYVEVDVDLLLALRSPEQLWRFAA